MKIDVLQHISFEKPAAIGEWASDRGHELRIHKLYGRDPVPRPEDIQFLILLGGPMSANDKESWLEEERRLIRNVIHRGTPVFGVCLGAQQIAKALGAAVTPGPKEVGWHPVQTTSGTGSFIPDQLTAFHWHGEQFAIPDQAERLFSSAACRNQGFVFRQHVIGLQFHLETTPESVRLLLTHDGDYIDSSRYVQSAEEIENFPVPEENRVVLFHLLDDLVSHVS